MSDEIYWLTWNVVLTAVMVIPYAVYRVGKLGGLWQAFLRPLPGDSPFDDEWAHRAYRAHMNAFEGIALFAPVAIGVHVTGMGTEATAIACQVYFWARLIYAPMYYFKVPILRTTIWFVGLASTLYLAYVLLS
ncbi:MAG TPA: MAPEG family protein [Gammaproteobacteria bacterium]|nr:MAPEG family protein [Gammaproteobacteria bacterium]